MQNTAKTPTRNAFESYFKKILDDFWKNKNNSLPKIPYRKTIDLDLVQPNTIENGYVQWLPKLQNSAVDIEDIEARIGSKIHPEVLQYFTTYWFLSLRGMFDNMEIDLPIETRGTQKQVLVGYIFTN